MFVSFDWIVEAYGPLHAGVERLTAIEHTRRTFDNRSGEPLQHSTIRAVNRYLMGLSGGPRLEVGHFERRAATALGH